MGDHPAYPITAGNQVHSTGVHASDWFAQSAPITLRDAAMACGFSDLREALTTDAQRVTLFAVMAMLRYEYADAMIAAREVIRANQIERGEG